MLEARAEQIARLVDCYRVKKYGYLLLALP